MIRRLLLAAALTVLFTVNPWPADGHLVPHPDAPTLSVLENRERSQRKNLAHAEYVCRNGGGKHKAWACWASSSVIRDNGQGWLRREWNKSMNLLRPKTDPTVANMIAAAEAVKAASPGSDPWPNCPDPYDGGGYSWHDTKACESPGWSWYEDPPGYYCGPLQLDPVIWASVIRRFGVPC